MSEMVERVARAIFHSNFPENEYENFDEDSQNKYLESAKAAIEAMREPTEAMINRTNPAKEMAQWQIDEYKSIITDSYKSMINVALNEENTNV